MHTYIDRFLESLSIIESFRQVIMHYHGEYLPIKVKCTELVLSICCKMSIFLLYLQKYRSIQSDHVEVWGFQTIKMLHY